MSRNISNTNGLSEINIVQRQIVMPHPFIRRFETPGTHQFVVPKGVSRLLVGVFGGGGTAHSQYGGGGGAGVSAFVDVVENELFNLVVGDISGTSSFGDLITCTGGGTILSSGAKYQQGKGGIYTLTESDRLNIVFALNGGTGGNYNHSTAYGIGGGGGVGGNGGDSGYPGISGYGGGGGLGGDGGNGGATSNVGGGNGGGGGLFSKGGDGYPSTATSNYASSGGGGGGGAFSNGGNGAEVESGGVGGGGKAAPEIRLAGIYGANTYRTPFRYDTTELGASRFPIYDLLTLSGKALGGAGGVLATYGTAPAGGGGGTTPGMDGACVSYGNGGNGGIGGGGGAASSYSSIKNRGGNGGIGGGGGASYGPGGNGGLGGGGGGSYTAPYGAGGPGGIFILWGGF